MSKCDWQRVCAAVIPCLNEEAEIGAVVQGVRMHLRSIFVVDDGSNDRTGQIAAEAGAMVLRHSAPQGKGAALRDGWHAALNSNFSWVLTLDGDGQHASDDIPRFFERAARGSALLVSGNRMADPKGMPLVRRWVNRWMSWRLSALAGVSLPDTQNGFRLMNLAAWSALPIQSEHFEVESEVLLAFARARHVIEFVPVQVIYRREHSKIHPLRDTWRWFRWLRRAQRR